MENIYIHALTWIRREKKHNLNPYWERKQQVELADLVLAAPDALPDVEGVQSQDHTMILIHCLQVQGRVYQ